MQKKKNMKKIKAGAAIFAVVAATFLLGAGPAIIAIEDPGSPYHDRVQVWLNATDTGAGVDYINYSIGFAPAGGGPGSQTTDIQFYGASVTFNLTDLGYYTISYYAVDNMGNVEPRQTTSFWLNSSDSTPPTTTIHIEDQHLY